MGFFQAGMLIEQLATTATAAGTTTLVATSKQNQVFTGTSTQTIKLPDVTTMSVGAFFNIYNQSTGSLTLEFQSGAAFTDAAGISHSTIAANTSITVTLQTNSGVSPQNGTWAAVASSAFAGGNLSANSFIPNYTTTVSSGSTITLTSTSSQLQYITGTTAQTLVLPVTSTLSLGQSYVIVNTSTAVVTVESSGANSLVAMPGNTQVIVTCILTSGTTAASWSTNFATPNVPVVAHAKVSTNTQSITSATTIINFDTVIIDTASAITTGASWHFTAPLAGYYRISASIQSSSFAASGVNNAFQLVLFKNGSAFLELGTDYIQTVSGCRKTTDGTAIIQLAATDTIDCRSANSGNESSVTLDGTGTSTVYISIERC